MEKHVILIGFMGSGKSTIGKKLAEELGVSFVDSDTSIEAKEGCSVSEIFEQKGEDYFREKEREFIAGLDGMQPSVVSVGGGMPCFFDNMEQLKMKGKVFYLNVSVMTLVKRVMAERATRPLLASLSDQEVSAFVFDKLIERTTFYRKAHHIIPNETVNTEATVADILKVLG